MAQVQAVPALSGEVTAEWLTEVLRGGGSLSAAGSVKQVKSEPIGEGVGFSGEVARFRIEYDGPADGAPSTIVGKFPSPNEGSRTIAKLYGLYERESNFYNDLADGFALRTPKCYFAAVHPDGHHALLLEDMADTGRVGDQLAGCGRDEATTVLSEMARMHAQWWKSDRLSAVPWLPKGADLVRGALQAVYPALVPKALDIVGAHLTQEIIDAVKTLDTRALVMLEDADSWPMTLIHGDFRLDNMIFGNEGSGYKIAVIDWQSPNQGWAGYDVAYFLSGGLSIEDRRKHERDLVRHYHEALRAGGVRDYDWDTMWLDYRRSMLAYLAIFVINGATLEQSNERAVALFEAIFTRLAAAITDLDSLELLPS
jgi:hypothetical protein